MATPDHGAETGRRPPAASRIVGQERIECRVGWPTPVHRLAGAARIVWEAVCIDTTTSTIAETVGVEADDQYLHEALTMLAGSGLFERVDQ